MSVRFCILGSGSAGNAALLMTPQAHILIDLGFSPAEIAARLQDTGASWETIDAVVLSHTHGDHLKRNCLRELARREIRFYAHARHVKDLSSTALNKSLEAGLVRPFEHDVAFDVAPGVRFLPFRIPHDCPPTFGFRIEVLLQENKTSQMESATRIVENASVYGQRIFKLGYLADLGYTDVQLISRLNDVDLLALEFNHDEELQRNSKRHPRLIARVLSTLGHLSNRQAAQTLEGIIRQNGNGGPKILVQMHLSEECNRPQLAYRCAQEVVEKLNARTRIFSSRQHERGTIHVLE